MVNSIKIGSGVAAVLFGLYLINLNSQNITYVITGILSIAIGIGILSSEI